MSPTWQTLVDSQEFERVRTPGAEGIHDACERAIARGVRGVKLPAVEHDMAPGTVAVPDGLHLFADGPGATVMASAVPPGPNAEGAAFVIGKNADTALGHKFSNLKAIGGVVEEGTHPRRTFTEAAALRQFVGSYGASAPTPPEGAHHLRGDITIEACKFLRLGNLPILLRGVEAEVNLRHLRSQECLDMGLIAVDRVSFLDIRGLKGYDNVLSVSRGCQKIEGIGLYGQEHAFAALWLAGFSGEGGPTDLNIQNVTGVKCGWTLALKSAPARGVISGVYGYQLVRDVPGSEGAFFGTTMVLSGLPDFGAEAPTSYAEWLNISNWFSLEPGRGDVILRGAKNVRLRNGRCVNPGQKFMPNGTTQVSSLGFTNSQESQLAQNFGIAADVSNPELLVTDIDIDDYHVSDIRGTPFGLFPLVVRGTQCARWRIGPNVTAEGMGKSIAPSSGANEGVRQNAAADHLFAHGEQAFRKTRQLVAVAAASFGAVSQEREAVNDSQNVTTGGATGGTGTLTLEGQTTEAIARNASAETVQNAIKALSNVGAGNVVVTLNSEGNWTVVFQGALAGVYMKPLKWTSSFTGGTGATVTKNKDGGQVSVYYRSAAVTFPVPYAEAPRVNVEIQGTAGTVGVFAGVASVTATGCTVRCYSSRPSCPANEVMLRVYG